jgi:hypothetical protein
MSSGRKLGACHSFVDFGGVAVVVLGIFTKFVIWYLDFVLRCYRDIYICSGRSCTWLRSSFDDE